MRFAEKTLLVFVTGLLTTVGVNVVGLQYFTTRYFDNYVSEMKQAAPEVNFDLLGAFLSDPNLDDSLVAEYSLIVRDLTNLSNSLDRFSKDPKAYSSELTQSKLESLQKIGLSGPSIERYLSVNAIESFVGQLSNFSILDAASPEGVFVLRVLRAMLGLNAVLLLGLSGGAWFWVRSSFAPVRSATQGLATIMNRHAYEPITYSGRDEFGTLIGAINELQQNLARQEKIRSDFLSDLSHEIKTPITAIKCYLEGIRDGMIALDQESAEMLEREIDRLIAITERLMAYEAIEQREMSALNRVPTNLIDAVAFVAREYTKKLRTHRQKIEFPIGASVVAEVDPSLWTQVVHNIVANFLKHTDEGATLAVSKETEGDWVHMRFVDDGRGVPAQEVAFLREKFYQAEKSRSHNDGGIGIGLAIVDSIVRLHGGTMTIVSDVGKGFSVHIKLPIRASI